jgi:hypothetical protein
MLTDSGVFEYNGIAFTALYRSHVSSKPVQDEARRTTVYVEHALEFDGFIVAQTTDTTMTAMRKALTKQGAKLYYQNKGFGDLIVNNEAGGPRDVAYGPIPEILEFTPIAAANGARVKWRCVTRIPECDDAKYEQAILALNYDINYDIDSDGYTIISVSGYLEIAATRRLGNTTDRTILDSADRYREQIATVVPKGFQREQKFRLSKDKRRLDFNWTDKQLPAALPRFCTRVDARESFHSGTLGKGAGGMRVWTVTFDITIVVAAGENKALAWAVFLGIVESRLAKIRPANKNDLMLQDLTFGEDIFGKESHFRAQFLRAGIPLPDLIRSGGLWQPVSDFDAWGKSLTETAHHIRGQIRAKHDPNSEAIIDLCIGSAAPQAGGPPPSFERAPSVGGGGPEPKRGDPLRGFNPPLPPGPSGGITGPPAGFLGGGDKGAPPGKGPESSGTIPGGLPSVFGSPKPDKESSWLAYQCVVRYVEDANVVRHKPLPQSALPALNAATGSSPATAVATVANGVANVTPASAPYQGAPKDLYQQPVSPTRTVVLSGYAVRVGHRVPPPALVSVGGVACVETFRDVSEVTMAAVMDTPVFLTRWTMAYNLDAAPTSVPHLPNPTFRTDGGAAPSAV